MTEAERIRDHYLEHPEDGISEVAEQLGLEPSVVHRIMDTHWVKEDGTIEEIGPGQGGGWAPPAEINVLPREIGNRWPDGELREDVFDHEDPLHWEIMGIPMPESEGNG